MEPLTPLPLPLACCSALIIGAQDTGYAMGTSCSGELVLLPPFKFYYWSPVMRAGAPSEAAAALNAAGLGMVQDKTFDAITERWYGAPEPPACITTQQQSVSVTFDQVRARRLVSACLPLCRRLHLHSTPGGTPER